MKYKTSRQLQSEQTKLNIFNAALRLLDEKELEDITIRDIVKEANVSIGSFYNSYNSKLDVFYETYTLSDRYFEEKVKPKLTQDTYCGRILFFFEEYGRYQVEIGSFALTKVLYTPNNPYFHRDSDYGMLPIIKELCQQAKNSGEFSTELSADYIADYLMICARGVTYDWCICGGSYDLKSRMCEYMSLLINIFK